MNDYQKKMIQVLKTKAAINTAMWEVFTLMTMSDEPFGDTKFDSDDLNDFFQRGIVLLGEMAEDVQIAHFG